MKQEINGEVTKEFPQGRENYCPKCYFEDDTVILRVECPHNKKTNQEDSLQVEHNSN